MVDFTLAENLSGQQLSIIILIYMRLEGLSLNAILADDIHWI